ncbi:peroxidase family protein [Aspergillus undulatus]|uniref:peroxidase family protein n=1 Tax=Aspergillus undulatus TaxID=1810928 RepID=UPI003CCC9EF0
MKLAFLLETALFGLAAASSCPFGHDQHKWQKPRPEDRRPPCPGLNVLANHCWLPRNGKDIDLATLRTAVSGAYNYERHSFDDAFHQALEFNLSTTGNSSTFHLSDLRWHDTVEFDGSLSRNDAYFGDNIHFNPASWATVAERLNLYEAGECGEDKYVTVETAAKARAARVEDAKKINPMFNNSVNAMQGSPGTTALYLTTLWDDEAEAVPKTWVKSFFEDERIPYIEGYKPPQKPRNGADILNMNKRVLAVKA